MKVLIVGGVAGGASCAARLRRLDEKAEITVLERGEFISFANCGLPYYIGGEITDKSKLTLQTPTSLKRRFNIDVRAFCEAISVDPQAKCVTVREANGNTYTQNYDKLVLSPGAAPILPKIEGIKSERVFTLRNIPDTLRIKSFIDVNKPRSAVVVGGGYVGIEMAENLVKAGIDVTVVELSDHLIAPLDFDMAADVHHYVRSKGIKLVLGSAVTAIKNREQGITVQTQKGNIDADMVIMSVGVKPETAFLSGSGIATNARGSIIVDEHMRTSAEDIYAVGDAVEILSFITKQPAFIPLAGPANKQGRIAADNICGISSKYCGTQGSAVVKIFDMTVATTGLNESSAKAA
ncbi:MAG: CoA-disulfide reductase, partial [Clostridiales bacterium]|nr:CoA-disulfide reductase [Clostridiales bacterium]